MPADDRAGLVLFGRQALVERPPSGERTLGTLMLTPDGARTNIAEAVQLALALLPAEGQRRIVLLSDGAENAGDALAAARVAAAGGVPLDVLSLADPAQGPDTQITGLTLPASAREGQGLRLVVDTLSASGGEARLSVRVGQALLVDQPVQVRAGAGRLALDLPPPPAGFNRYVVRLEARDDPRPENNVAETYSLVAGRPRALLVEGEPGAARNLRDALEAAGVLADTVPPAQLPQSLGALSGYGAVVLVDVPLRALPPRAAESLRAYVRDLGRGLAMVGGTQSFGAGGYAGSPIEEALPVSMDLRTAVRLPAVSVAVVIDVSGSMAEEVGGRSKVQLAAEGAARLVEQLRPDDEIAVIPFDSEPRSPIGPLPGSERAEILQLLEQIGPGGGGIEMRPALAEAARYLRASAKPVRHLITITDGNDSVGQEGARELVGELRAERVTVTSIAVGDGEHVPFLQDVVRLGGGRFFLTEDAATIPIIMTQEAQAVIQPYIIEGRIAPQVGLGDAGTGILRGVDATPPLFGYVATTPKASAQQLLLAPRGDPLLAVWQFGLGRSLAWTSDMKGQWAREWLGWERFGRVAAQMVAALLPPEQSPRLQLSAQAVGGQLVLAAQASDDASRPATGLALAGSLVAGDGSALPVTLREVAPGSYRAVLGDARPGAYLVTLAAADAAGQPFAAVSGGAVMPLSSEYRSSQGGAALLDALAGATGGRVSPEPEAVFERGGASRGAISELWRGMLWLALLLLPIDIAARRLLRGMREVRRPTPLPRLTPAPSAAPVAAAPAPPPNDKLARLRDAQERARRRARGEAE
jgi:uncharacterized membrane protein